MPRVLPVVLALVALGCAPPVYVQPDVSEPHATVTVRVLHHEASGPQMRFGARLDQFQLPVTPREPAAVTGPVTRTIRVRPQPTHLRFATRFFHTQTRMQTVYENERYACGTQSTGYGNNRSTSTRYCNRSVPRQRYRTVQVTDGACDSGLHLMPTAGTRYVVQYDYHANGHCRSRCFIRAARSGGQFQLTACPSPPRRTSGGSAR